MAAFLSNPALQSIYFERAAQDKKWGSNQDHPDGTGFEFRVPALHYKDVNDSGPSTWRDILLEEVFEALELDSTLPDFLPKLRAELVQVGAVAAAWVEAIDRRESDGV